MTRKTAPSTNQPPKSRRRAKDGDRLGYWALQDAKARFSELVRRVHSEGPQRVTVHGRAEVVVISAEEFSRLKGAKTGAALVAAMQSSPHRDIEIAPARAPMPVRQVIL
jgi:prevent-host-death family protein